MGPGDLAPRADVETDFTAQPVTPTRRTENEGLRRCRASAAQWGEDRFRAVRWPSGFICIAEMTGAPPPMTSSARDQMTGWVRDALALSRYDTVRRSARLRGEEWEHARWSSHFMTFAIAAHRTPRWA